MPRPSSVAWTAITLCCGMLATAHAQVTGFVATPDCASLDTVAGSEGELIIALHGFSTPHAVEFDLRAKGGATSEGTELTTAGYASRAAAPAGSSVSTDSVYARVTLGPLAPGEPCRVALDSGDGVDLGAVIPLLVGDSLPVGLDRGIGLQIAAAGTYPVNFGSAVRQYPQRGSDGSATIAFAPLAAGNPTGRGDACSISGWNTRRCDAENCTGIRGYDVYRLPSAGGTPPGPDEFTAALSDGDPTTGFVAFIDLRKFRLNVATDVTVDASVNDLDPADGASLHDPDGRMFSGDEVILWTDAAEGPRAHPVRAPRAGIVYRYAVQPVAIGRIDTLAPCYSLNCILDGDHLRDLDGNGADDAVDLDGLADTSLDVEFISPQADPAEGGLDGLGLTFRSKLLVSAAMTVPPTPPVLRRSTAVTALSPLAPPLATFLPLTVTDDYINPFATGDVDPDPAILTTGVHPLVFYEVTGQDDVRVAVSGPAGARRVQFTF